MGLNVCFVFPSIGAVSLAIPPPLITSTLIQALKDHPKIRFIELDGAVRPISRNPLVPAQ